MTMWLEWTYVLYPNRTIPQGTMNASRAWQPGETEKSLESLAVTVRSDILQLHGPNHGGSLVIRRESRIRAGIALSIRVIGQPVEERFRWKIHQSVRRGLEPWRTESGPKPQHDGRNNLDKDNVKERISMLLNKVVRTLDVRTVLLQGSNSQ